MQKFKKQLAKYLLNTNEEELNFALIGINCSENQYQLISLINDQLNIDLVLIDYLQLIAKEGKVFKYSLYKFVDEDLRLEINFVPNNSNFFEPNISTSNTNDLFSGEILDESHKLIRELPKTDYFLILKGEETHLFEHKIIEKLKNISEIVQIQTIQAQELSSKRNLIF